MYIYVYDFHFMFYTFWCYLHLCTEIGMDSSAYRIWFNPRCHPANGGEASRKSPKRGWRSMSESLQWKLRGKGWQQLDVSKSGWLVRTVKTCENKIFGWRTSNYSLNSVFLTFEVRSSADVFMIHWLKPRIHQPNMGLPTNFAQIIVVRSLRPSQGRRGGYPLPMHSVFNGFFYWILSGYPLVN